MPTQLESDLFVFHDNVNVGVLRSGGKALLIDGGSGEVRRCFTGLGISSVDAIILTHHHRDGASGVFSLMSDETSLGVPEAERKYFDDVESWWNDGKNRWHLYAFRPQPLMLLQSLRVGFCLTPGHEFNWGAFKLSVLATPGHTDGSVSIIVETEGGNRYAFTGDLIYGHGQVWDIYSLQKGYGGVDYHGFMGARDALFQSLQSVLDTRPGLLIPSHGSLIDDPGNAVAALEDRLNRCYENYLGISSLRHYYHVSDAIRQYFPGHKEGIELPDQLEIRPGKPLPSYLHHFRTTWMIFSETGEAFVMDCWAEDVIGHIRELRAAGRFSEVTAMWVTHYHDDHVDAIPAFQREFSCETRAEESYADIVMNPRRYRLPCISPAEARIDKVVKDGESWQWNEFTMTAFHLPGQTLYHGGLCVEGRGDKLFFSGDSFTMGGIDDYCPANRNLLGKGRGYLHCLDVIDKLNPTHIFNCHVDDAFDFTPAEIQYMRDKLIKREKLYGEVLPWDDPNYGLDENWVQCLPYEQDVGEDRRVSLRVAVTNHSFSAKLASARPTLPGRHGDFPTKKIKVPPRATGEIKLDFEIPEALYCPRHGQRVPMAVDFTFDNRYLGQFREAVLVLG